MYIFKKVSVAICPTLNIYMWHWLYILACPGSELHIHVNELNITTSPNYVDFNAISAGGFHYHISFNFPCYNLSLL